MNIDINCDLGENITANGKQIDAAIMPYISSVNIACGFHAGDPLGIQNTLKLAKEHNVQIGAHPGFDDKANFGRKPIKLSPDELSAILLYQIGAVKGMALALGTSLRHVKAHGALYTMAAADFDTARILAEAVQAYDPELAMVCLAQSEMVNAAESIGLRYVSEVFADRSYRDDGQLVPRTASHAMLHDVDEMINRVIRMVKDKTVVTETGKSIHIQADTICIHGDSPQALPFARKLSAALKSEGIELEPFNHII